MPSKVGPRPRYGNSRRCDTVDGLLQTVTGAASPDAAHQRARHTERRFLDMVRLFARALWLVEVAGESRRYW